MNDFRDRRIKSLQSQIIFRLNAVVLFLLLILSISGGNVEAEVFYCEANPESGETIVAAFQGSVKLVAKLDGTAVIVSENTSRLVDKSGRIGPESKTPSYITERVNIWEDVLIFGSSLLDRLVDFFATTQWSGSQVNLGGIRPGKNVKKTISLSAMGITDSLLEDLQIDQDFPEYPGVYLYANLRKEYIPKRSLYVVLSAEIDEDADVRDHQLFRGAIILQGTESRFNRKKYGMQIAFRALNPQATEPPAQGEYKSRIRLSLSDETSGTIKIGLLIMFAVAMTSGGALYLYNRVSFDSKPEVQGRLALVYDPARGKHNIDTIDLQLAAHSLKKREIILGNGPAADIQLPHKSVRPEHCRLFPQKEKGKNKMYITPIGNSKIMIDQRAFDRGAYHLHGKTQISVGKFVFDFELTDTYKQLEVLTMDGEIQRGVIDYKWDLASVGFNIFLFEDKHSSFRPPTIHFDFSEIKAIKFYRSGGKFEVKRVRSLLDRPTKNAIIEFKDGTKLNCRLNASDRKKAGQYIFAFPEKGDRETDYFVIIKKNVNRISFS